MKKKFAKYDDVTLKNRWKYLQVKYQAMSIQLQNHYNGTAKFPIERKARHLNRELKRMLEEISDIADEIKERKHETILRKQGDNAKVSA